MLWTDAQAPGPESLYCPRGSDAAASLSEVGSGHFPVAGGVEQELIAADTLHAGCFQSSWWCGSHWTLVHTPDHILAPDALALK